MHAHARTGGNALRESHDDGGEVEHDQRELVQKVQSFENLNFADVARRVDVCAKLETAAELGIRI